MDSSIDWYNDYIGTDWQSGEEVPVAELIESLASLASSDYQTAPRQEIIRVLVALMAAMADEHG